MSRHVKPPAPELHARVLARIEECARIVDQRSGSYFRTPEVAYFEGRAAAGTAVYADHRVELNRTLLVENVDDMLHDTIAHEVAHLACKHLRDIGKLGPRERWNGHGRVWQHVMRSYFGIEPSRTHSYDMSNVRVKRQHRWLYTCACPGREHKVTTAKHHKMLNFAACGYGRRYLCIHCRTPITFADQRVS